MEMERAPKECNSNINSRRTTKSNYIHGLGVSSTSNPLSFKDVVKSRKPSTSTTLTPLPGNYIANNMEDKPSVEIIALEITHLHQNYESIATIYSFNEYWPLSSDLYL
jgi:hypothetical protein